MQIGLSVFPTMASIHPTRLGPEAEARGFDSIFTVEHTHIPASRKTPYPMGGDLPSIYWESFEPFTYLSMIAAVTETLRIGTGVCLVAEHHPITLAKRVAGSLCAASPEHERPMIASGLVRVCCRP
jgi:alkanesulfonate monooxygenase SsuD/methylene tetrahydromethanopterin reductase-like flavin-dependent oxidoreductase (luciferase family)